MTSTHPIHDIPCPSVGGKLRLFARSRVIVLRPWPDLRAWTKLNRHKNWSCFRPVIDLGSASVKSVLPRHYPGSSRAGELPSERGPEWRSAPDFFASIPQPVREVVEAFRFRQWHLLSASARCEGFLELLASNPGLGFALASPWCFSATKSGDAIRVIRRLANRKRTHIAESLGFERSDSCVRLLSKMTPSSVLILDLRWIPKALANPYIRSLLRHVPRVNAAVLSTIRLLRPENCTPQLVNEIGENDLQKQAVTGDLLDIRRCWDTKRRPPIAIRSLRELRSTAAEMRDEYEFRTLLKFPTFPPCPLPLPDFCEPLDCPEKLIREGKEMGHCIAQFTGDVAHGITYGFRLFSPERASLLIRRSAGRWELDELRGPGNIDVAPDTADRVENWIREANEACPF